MSSQVSKPVDLADAAVGETETAEFSTPGGTSLPANAQASKSWPVTAPGSFRSHRFHVLDGMRGIAALVVMDYHYGLLNHILAVPNAFVAVDVFFILSGFVICHSYGGKIASGMPASDYMVRRIARLFPTMALGIAIDLPFFYWQTAHGLTTYSTTNIFESGLSNLFFLPAFTGKEVYYPGLWVDTLFPIDPPLWSIFFEMVASIGFLALVKLRERQLVKLIGLAFALILVSSLVAGLREHHLQLDPDAGWSLQNFLRGFPRVFYGFACGMLLYKLQSQTATHPRLKFVQSIRPLGPLWLYACLTAVLIFPFKMSGIFYLITIVGFAPFLIMQGGKTECHGLVRSCSEWLGWLSYPIYCLHLPILDVIQLLNQRYEIVGHTGVSCEVIAFFATFVFAALSAVVLDRFVQRQFGGLLQRTINAAAAI